MNLDFKIRNRRRSGDETHEREEFRVMFRCHKGNSSTQSNPSSENNINDTRTAGSEGSIVLGSGSSGQVQVVNQDVSADVVERLGAQNADLANSAIQAVANTAVDTARAATESVERASYEAGRVVQGVSETALNANKDVVSKALDTNRAVTGDALVSVDKAVNASIGAVSDANRALSNTTADVLNFRSKDTEDALSFAAEAQKQTNDLIRYTNEQFTQKLASNAGDAPQNTIDNVVKYVTIAGTILGAVALFRQARKS